RPYPQWGPITYAVFSENANYNALQAKYESRNWHGLNTLISYAWSKCIDSGSLQGGTTLLLLNQNRGPCNYDLPQTFTGSFDYALPFGHGARFLSGANRFVNELVSGWGRRESLLFNPAFHSR